MAYKETASERERAWLLKNVSRLKPVNAFRFLSTTSLWLISQQCLPCRVNSCLVAALIFLYLAGGCWVGGAPIFHASRGFLILPI